MDVSELLAKAWAAVESSGVPKELQETAFREAVSCLRDGGSGSGSGRGAGGPTGGTTRKTPKATKAAASNTAETPGSGHIDTDEFFSRIAHESGVDEAALRDTLKLVDGAVHVLQPTRQLGSSKSEQARTVIALVAAARGIGLGEDPVNAPAVHDELKRKRCWDANNFAATHLGPLRGFNAGSKRGEIVLASKWPKEFEEAINRIHGEGRDED
jgi:hypothetical protein